MTTAHEAPFRLEAAVAAEVPTSLPEASCQAALCDPPYGLGLFGLAWDQEIPGPAAWKALARVLEPGA